jgi:hypothetical protein
MERYTVPAETLPAICVGVIDCGTQHWEWMGEAKKGHKVRLQWELPTEDTWTGDDGVEHARTTSREYTASLHEKAALRATLVSWRGRDFTEDELAGFDLTTILGKPCMLSIIHKTKATGGVYAKVDNVSKIAKGITVPKEPVSPLVSYSIEDGADGTFKAFPEWIKNIIIGSEEWQSKPVKPEALEAAAKVAKELGGKVVDPPHAGDVPF